jgi:hypothetical protein
MVSKFTFLKIEVDLGVLGACLTYCYETGKCNFSGALYII